MNATERLRKLLKERGAEYDDYIDTCTAWLKSERGYMAFADESDEDGLLSVELYLTPEQAVEATLGRGDYTYEQWRAISDAVAAAMQYAHDRAIEHPDKADPYWNLDEYVERVCAAAFGDDATMGRETCHMEWSLADNGWADHTCSNCGYVENTDVHVTLDWNFCPKCGARIKEAE